MKDSTLKILSVLPYVMIPAALYASYKTDPVRVMLTPQERMLLDYPIAEETAVEVRANERPKAGATPGAGPFVIEKSPGPAPGAFAGALRKSAEAARAEKGGGLTLVVFNGEQSVAVIDGEVVRTGEKAGKMTVEKIEKDRVLVFDGRLKWMHMERER